MSNFSCPIVPIEAVEPIPGKDRIVLYKVLGYQSIDQKDEYAVGQQVGYIPPDALLPLNRPEFQFLAPRAKQGATVYRLRTAKFGGVLSQGLLVPVPSGFKGDDLKDYYGVVKYEPPEEADPRSQDQKSKYNTLQRWLIKVLYKGRKAKGFPNWIPQTDSENWQRYPNVFYEYPDEEFVASEKCEGCSSTFYLTRGYRGEYGICSRSVLKYTHEPGTAAWQLKFAILKLFGVRFFINMKNHWVEASKKYNLEERLRKYAKEHNVTEIAIQAEVLGPTVGAAVHNLYKLQYTEMRVFDILLEGKYVPYDQFNAILSDLGLAEIAVPLVYRGKILPKEEMVSFSNGPSLIKPDVLREGLVWKPATRELTHHNMPNNGRVQLKVKSPEYAIKYGTE